ncbi:MAG: hypothetical protein RSD57_19545 [Comamonas sp.]
MANQVQDEAAKAAKVIRDALEEFTRITGLKADVSANWIDLRTVGSHRPTAVLESVTIRPFAADVDG